LGAANLAVALGQGYPRRRRPVAIRGQRPGRLVRDWRWWFARSRWRFACCSSRDCWSISQRGCWPPSSSARS